MRRFSRPGKRKRRRGSITAGLSGRKLAAHHREMLRKTFPKRGGQEHINLGRKIRPAAAVGLIQGNPEREESQ